mgnify:CR=1 FL=1
MRAIKQGVGLYDLSFSFSSTRVPKSEVSWVIWGRSSNLKFVSLVRILRIRWGNKRVSRKCLSLGFWLTYKKILANGVEFLRSAALTTKWASASMISSGTTSTCAIAMRASPTVIYLTSLVESIKNYRMNGLVICRTYHSATDLLSLRISSSLAQ